MTNAELPQQTATLTIDQADGTASHSTKPASGQVAGYLQQAIAHHQAGQLQDAERLYRAILQAQPNHPDANHNLGVLAVQVKQPAAALPHFKMALEANPSQSQYWLSYIDALIQTSQTDAARQVLEQGRQRGLQGAAVEALVVRLGGDAQVAGQSNAENQHTFKELLPVSPLVPQHSKKKSKTNPVRPDKSAGKSAPHQEEYPSPQEKNTLVALFTGGRYTEAATLAQTMTQRFPLHELGWMVLGAVFKQMGRSVDALAPMQKAAALLPNNAEVHNNLGNTLKDLGRLDEAEASYRRALQIKPDYAEAHNNLGITLKDLGRLDEAEMSYRRALEIKPDFAEAHYNLGNILRDLGRLDEAEASYRRALQIKPNYAEAHNNLGNTLKDLGRLDEAEVSYRQVLQIKPDFAEAHSNLGAILMDLGRLDEAEASCRQALEIKPDYAEGHNNLGTTLHALGRLDEAEVSYRRALQIKPHWASLYFNLHSLLLNPDDMAPSIKCMEKAVEIDSSNANFRFFLGMMLDYTGDPEAAANHFDRVEKSANLYRARLDAWQYLKSANNRLPLITGSNIQTFKLGIDAAANDGLILEFGVRFGSSIRQIAALVDQEVHGFDSFEGLPEQWHHEPQGSYSTKGVIPNVPDNVTLYAGWFEDTLPEFLKNHIGPVRFMNIDCDIYSSTKTVLDLLADRIIPGSVIVFDEYIGNEHWREDEFKAFQEAVVKYNWDYEYICFSFFTKQVVIRIVQVQ